jgi:glucosamine--fructose-6-phosphate aminotransferase (isomerizing)
MAKKGCPVIPLQAGPELSVISTKAFTAQLAAFARILLAYLDTSETKHLLRNDLQNIPSLMHEVLSHADDFHKAAQILTTASLVLFLGRGELYPIALEGALKLKEISYIFAEGYPAGEMKHGPLALIDEKTVSVVLAPSDELFEKTLSNAQEIVARGGRMVFLTDTAGSTHVPSLKIDHSHVDVVLLPDSGPLSKAFVYAGAVQVLAYKTAKILGKDVDRPRNLAKAVTVE